MYYVADFETNNSETECRVWGFGIVNIFNPNSYVDGTTLDEFMQIVSELSATGSITIGFHNLKFDGEFIVHWLMTHGYVLEKEKNLAKDRLVNRFSTLISGQGVWYLIQFVNEFGQHVRIIDTLKIYPFSVKELAKSFGLHMSKGEIDYSYVRPIGHQLTDEERDYIRRDVLIVAQAWQYSIKNQDTAITMGSNALNFYKRQLSYKTFEKYYPPVSIEEDEFIRKSYRGGWVYCNPRYKQQEIGAGIVLDVNSLYPSRMRYEVLPYGTPLYFMGKYKESSVRPLYVQRLECKFRLKEGYLPTIQLKGNMSFIATEYAVSSKGETVELTLTSVDLALFLEHYDVEDIYYLDGYAFHGSVGLFDAYIDHWMSVKITAEEHGDKAMRTLAKLKQNALYGKFAKRPTGRSKYPCLDDGVVKLELGELEDQNPLYIPMGTFITAYARNVTIRAAQKCYDRFLYADTDSLHLIGYEVPDYIEVHKTNLGAWKHEADFRRAKYIGAKCYIEDVATEQEDMVKFLEEYPDRLAQVDLREGYKLSIVCAGLPDSAKGGVTFENFNVGKRYWGKLLPKHVEGGIVLKETSFLIRER